VAHRGDFVRLKAHPREESEIMRRLFVSQELLDQWAGQGKIELSGNQLKILAENRTFGLRPGARFLSLAAGQDSNKLVGKVKSEEQLKDLGCELYMSSVLMGEDAYDIQPGFLAEVTDTPPSATASVPDIPLGTTEPGVGGGPDPHDTVLSPKQDDEKSALAKFLLENLT
jgi:hypothetical protein